MNVHSRWTGLREWAFLALAAVLCLVLGLLQYRWTGEVSIAERDRLRSGLSASLARLSREFNSEVTSAALAIAPNRSEAGEDRLAQYTERYEQWRESTHHGRLFARIGVVVPSESGLKLRMMNLDNGTFADAEWPEHWRGHRDRMGARIDFMRAMRDGGPPPRPPDEPGGGPRGMFAPPTPPDAAVLEMPRFFGAGPGSRRGGERMESEWVMVELDQTYAREVLFPEYVQRHLGSSGDYQVEVTVQGHPDATVFRSGPAIGETADAATSLLELQFDQVFRRGPGGGRPKGEGRSRKGGAERAELKGDDGPGGPGGPRRGRWRIAARHSAGSLEAVVQRTRWRNFAVATAILGLMLASVAALIRFTQRAHRLANLQMEFVTGVSHELRTPLSVIKTAAHNLQAGRVNPAKIERYGTLIAEETDRLTGIVEQILLFAGAKAGKTIRAREAVPVRSLVDDAITATARAIESAGCKVETTIDPAAPPVLADPVAIRHALQNLLTNAAKYGSDGRWIGVTVERARDAADTVEIRVADKGQGIPGDETGQIFEPFYRGKRAVEDQIHGTGLGLNLVKRIMEAHDGGVSVKSKLGEGTEFTLRIPAAPAEQVDEFAHTTG